MVLDTEVLLRGLGCSRDRNAEGEHRGLALLPDARPTPGWAKAELRQGGREREGGHFPTLKISQHFVSYNCLVFA